MAKTADSSNSFAALQKKIKSGDFSPLYLLHGEEPYFIDSICDLLEESILPEAERSFNQSIVYGKEIKMNDLVSMARRYPMMSKYQVIIVKEAKELKDWDKLEAYLNQPVNSTILVFCHKNGKLDMRSKAAKLLAKFDVLLSDKLKDYQIKTWVTEFVKQKGRVIDGAAVELLVDFIGDDLSSIHNELEKLFISVKEDFIKTSHVEANVGNSRKFSVFDFQKALGQRNFNKSVQIANQMAIDLETSDYFPIIALLYKFFSKVTAVYFAQSKSETDIAMALGVNKFFVGDYILAARNYTLIDLEKVINELKVLDLKLKGVHRGAAEDGQLLIEMVVRILKK